jgi:hypothetical protein
VAAVFAATTVSWTSAIISGDGAGCSIAFRVSFGGSAFNSPSVSIMAMEQMRLLK